MAYLRVGSSNHGFTSFPVGYVHQDKIFQSGRETNSLTDAYVNYYEVSLTLKSSTSYVHAVVESTYKAQDNDDGGACTIIRNTSSPVEYDDTTISALHAYDGTGPHDIMYAVGTWNQVWMRFSVHGLDTFSGVTRSVGDTMYYGIFVRKYQSGSTAYCPGGGSSGNSEFIVRLTEVQQ